MVVTVDLYDTMSLSLANGDNDWDAGTGVNEFKGMLLKSAYTLDRTHDVVDDLVTHEVAGTGYTAGGVEIDGFAISTASNIVKVDCDDIVFTTVTLTGANAPRYLIIYSDSGTVLTSTLYFYIDFGADQAPSAANLTYTIAANGLYRIKKAA